MTAKTVKILGLDLDNTIVSYENVFRQAARERGITVPTGVSAKNALRDHYHRIGDPDEFTRLQGFSYGLGMKTAEPYPAFPEALQGLLASGWQVWIISHRTRHPILGPREDLHAAAREWLSRLGLFSGQSRRVAGVHLEETREGKLARIRERGCTAFVDDLLEVLRHPGFPASCRGLWFAPAAREADYPEGKVVRSWLELPGLLEA
jgi:hypothetical protein